MADDSTEESRLLDASLPKDRVEIRSSTHLRSDDWEHTLRYLDGTCLLLQECIKKYPDNVALIEKLLKAQEQLFQATKLAEEQRQKNWMEKQELFLEQERRKDIWDASGPRWGTNERLAAMKSISVYHRK